jgi:hypothetical protein
MRFGMSYTLPVDARIDASEAHVFAGGRDRFGCLEDFRLERLADGAVV